VAASLLPSLTLLALGMPKEDVEIFFVRLKKKERQRNEICNLFSNGILIRFSRRWRRKRRLVWVFSPLQNARGGEMKARVEEKEIVPRNYTCFLLLFTFQCLISA